MSQVHKADRGDSRFEVMDHAVILKNKLRELDIIRNWKTCICRIDKGFTWLQRNIRLRDDGTVSVKLKPKAVTRIKRRIRKLKAKVERGRVPLIDLVNMVKSWICARRDCLTYPQLRTIEQTVLSIYGREAYEQVYDHSERWKAT